MSSQAGRRLMFAAPFGLALLRPRGTAAQGGADIAQPADAGPAAFMRRAFEMRERALAAGDQGFGAVVVRAGRIVGESPSRVRVAGDPTAHAEIEAIRDAARRLGSRDLAGCELYGTFRACPMCEAAAHWAGIARLLHGTEIVDGGPPRLSRC